MVMYDSLNKGYLSPYGCDFTHTPNFQRLAKRAVRFDNFFVGSMPCMPARRELHTGRYNFLHRGWGPLEPFDDSMPQILREKGVHTHLVTDHYHYLEDGGATYHNRYSSWEVIRGQEGDFWKGEVKEPDIPPCEDSQRAREMPRLWRQDWINRKYFTRDEEMPQSRTFAAGLEFMETNKDADNWFLQIESFDPHEPFFTQQEYKDLYPHEYKGKHLDWPSYGPVRESEELVNHLRAQYSALVSMCDAKLGLVLDVMDKYNMWEDTMLIVNTDHGFLMGEHNWWAKNIAPLYNEVANTPFFLYDPRYKKSGVCDKLAQTIDIPATLLEFFGAEIPEDMQGKALKLAYEENETIHEQILYGYFGGTLNTTDGRYTYLCAPIKAVPIHEYTLMPANMNAMFSVAKLAQAELSPGFHFTKGARVLKFKMSNPFQLCLAKNLLFDTKEDPGQLQNLDDIPTETRLINGMLSLLKNCEAPAEQYERFGLPAEGEFAAEMLMERRKRRKEQQEGGIYEKYRWQPEAKELLYTILELFPGEEAHRSSGGMDRKEETEGKKSSSKMPEKESAKDHIVKAEHTRKENAVKEELAAELDRYLQEHGAGTGALSSVTTEDISGFIEKHVGRIPALQPVKKAYPILLAYARA